MLKKPHYGSWNTFGRIRNLTIQCRRTFCQLIFGCRIVASLSLCAQKHNRTQPWPLLLHQHNGLTKGDAESNEIIEILQINSKYDWLTQVWGINLFLVLHFFDNTQMHKAEFYDGALCIILYHQWAPSFSFAFIWKKSWETRVKSFEEFKSNLTSTTSIRPLTIKLVL